MTSMDSNTANDAFRAREIVARVADALEKEYPSVFMRTNTGEIVVTDEGGTQWVVTVLPKG